MNCVLSDDVKKIVLQFAPRNSIHSRSQEVKNFGVI